MLSENAERRRSVLDNLQKQLDEVISLHSVYVFFFTIVVIFVFCLGVVGSLLVNYKLLACISLMMLDNLAFFNIILCHHQAVLDMQLYEKALDVFEDDPATSVSCYRHHPYKTALYSTI